MSKIHVNGHIPRYFLQNPNSKSLWKLKKRKIFLLSPDFSCARAMPAFSSLL